MHKVVIDAGHGGSDPGAIGRLKTGHVVKESDIALKISNKTRDLLKDNKGIYTYFTREDDRFVGLQERCDFSNEIGANLFVSIHCNSFDGKKDNIPSKDPKGSEVHVYSGGKDAFLTQYEAGFKSSFKLEPYRCIKTSPEFYVLNGTICKAYLIETLFIDSEADILNDNGVQNLFAKIIHDSILKYFNLPIATSKPVPVKAKYDAVNEIKYMQNQALQLYNQGKKDELKRFLTSKSAEIIKNV